jgi:ABC-type Zn uptake system ZnuABC Zn-binding protein ZnuA
VEQAAGAVPRPPYFARRFGLEIDLFLEPKPGVGPSPAHLAATMQRMRELGARTIIVEVYLNRRTADTVASKTGATVVEVAQFPGGLPGTEAGYHALLDELVNRLATALGRNP